MKKRTKIILVTVTSIVVLVSLGGCAMTQKESNKQDKEVTSSKRLSKMIKKPSNKNSSLI